MSYTDSNSHSYKECAEDVFLFCHTSSLPKTLEGHLYLLSVIFPELRNWWKMLWCSNHAWHGPAVTYCCPACFRLYSLLPFYPLHSLCRCNWEPKQMTLPLAKCHRDVTIKCQKHGWYLGVWGGSVCVGVWSVSSVLFSNWVFLLLFQMEISVNQILVPTGPARTVLEHFPASVTKAGRGFCAIMVTLHLIHYKITSFVTGISVW